MQARLAGQVLRLERETRALKAVGLTVLICLLGCEAHSNDDEDGISRDAAVEIISECAEAFGGAVRLEELHTFRTIMSWDGEDPVVTDIQRPNLMRTSGRATLVFDGERAAQVGAPDDDLLGQAPGLLDPAVWKDFEIDLAFRFPAFFDYPTEYAGVDTLDGLAAHRLQVTLPLGTKVTYFIDTETHLPIKAQSAVTIDGTDYTPELTYGEFLEHDGILFPSMVRQGWTPETAQTGVVEAVEVNATFPDGHFRIPREVPDP